MKNRVLLLIMTLPIVLLIALFSMGKIASINTEISVSGIEITTQNDGGFIYIDRADYADDIVFSAQVFPVNASNQGYSFSVEYPDDECDIYLDADNTLQIKGNGKAKIVATSKDKGFTASVIVTAYSSKVFSITPKLTNVGGEDVAIDFVDDGAYSTSITTGIYDFSSVAEPSELSDASVVWSSGNSDILEVNPVTGKLKAKLSGQTYVVANCPSGVNGGVECRIDVQVASAYTSSGLLVNGLENNSVLSDIGTNTVSCLVENTSGALGGITMSGKGMAFVNDYILVKVGNGASQYRLTVELSEAHGSLVELYLSIGGENLSRLDLVFDSFSFNVFTAYHNSIPDDIYQKKDTEVLFVADSDIADGSISYTWEANSPIVSLSSADNGYTCSITALEKGSAVLTVKAWKNGKLTKTVIKPLVVVLNVQSVNFTDNATVYGIEKIKAVGTEVLSNGAYSTRREELKVSVWVDGAMLLEYPSDELAFASDSSCVRVFPTASSFKVEVVEDGIAKIKVEWAFNDYFGANISSVIIVRAVDDGVAVSDYPSLKKATEDGRRVILTNDVMLGEENMSLARMEALAYTLKTTYDWQFYENKGERQPSVYYLLEFKNDLFGNGFEINADRFTQAKDGSGMPVLFKGPLDFVAVSTASVKAQDNIVFLVQTDGVTLDNVVLKGCSDEKIMKDGATDLSLLNYTGTTLEIMSDCNVLNSRVSNGRTTVRVFSGATTDGKPVVDSCRNVDVKNEKLKMLIESCILSNAREFILKIGSNRALMHGYDGDGNVLIKKLAKIDGGFYEPYDQKNVTDDYFNENYLLTDVTLKNTVLSTSGLFSVGMETHFAGEMLAGVNNVANWTKLAATSYASALRLVGDVKLLDWKKIKNVDSSTLIETTNNAQQFLTLDISAMISKVASDSRYAPLISNVNGEQYVHGGVVFYGGGYNYSYVDTSELTSEFAKGLCVNLSVLSEGLKEDLNNPLYMQGTMLPLAAGYCDFKFYMYDSSSKNNYEYHQKMIEDGSAYILPVAGV